MSETPAVSPPKRLPWIPKPGKAVINRDYDISRIIVKLLQKKTFTGYFLARMDREMSTENILTCGVRYKDYQLSLIYNPDFMSSLSEEDQVNVIEHEALHVVLKHVFAGDRYLKHGFAGVKGAEKIGSTEHLNHQVLNIAFDYSVNSFLSDPSPELKKSGMFPDYYGLPTGKHHLYYLSMLLEKMQEMEEKTQKQGQPQSGGGKGSPQPGKGKGQPQLGDGSDPGGEEEGEGEGDGDGQAKKKGKGQKPDPKGQGDGEGEPQEDAEGQGGSEEEQLRKYQERFEAMSPDQRFEELAQGLLNQSKMQKFMDALMSKLDHSWDTGETADLTEQERQILEEVVGKITRDAKDSCEKDRGTFPGGLQSEIKRLYSKTLPWNVILRSLVQSAVHTSFKPAYNRRDRRFGIFPGHKRELKANVIIASDTSGSVSDKLLNAFYNEVDRIYDCQEMELDVIECDAAVQASYKYKRGDRPKCKGRGGTDFNPVFKHIKKKSMRPNVLIFFTDGFGPAPERPPKEYLTIWVYPSKNHSKQKWGVHLEMSPETAEY